MARIHSLTRQARLGAISGIVGACALLAGITALTWLQADFLRSLGWHPLTAPTLDWPSGLALGPYGAWMTALFVFGGCALIAFATGIRAWLALRQLPFTGAASAAFAVAGCGMAGLAFTTDPTFFTSVPTWHGRLHDAAFVVMGAGLAAGLIGFAAGTRRSPQLQSVAIASLFVAFIAGLGFALKGALFYSTFIAVFGWIIAIGLQILVSTRAD